MTTLTSAPERRVGDRILVATDLSARSDRAVERALSLARERGARLSVLHVIEASSDGVHDRRTPTSVRVSRIRDQIAADLGADAAHASIVVEAGQAARVIERVTSDERCDLVVLGVARVERFGRWRLGATAERVLREASAPVLVVTERPRGPYRSVAVATDFSEISAETTELAARLFPQQRIAIFHAHRPVGYAWMDASSAYETSLANGRLMYEQWLAGSRLPPSTRARIEVQIRVGEPTSVLRDAAHRGEFDLLAVGTHDRGRLVELILGSVARRVLAELPCDALFTRRGQLRRATERPRARPARGALSPSSP